ncbi:hypothetical protein HPB48_009963 [Haemaphysalis longicornis]|uniref:Peptidase aspartic putative domain-containing protein n=1 Tax=Haemaphysalis longicornis TaxID=44386 RepID=A0A9J6FXP7_HAELO|nr:hypothetical protein HPB48_009963 [Haemaphysalis longicornis]
MLVIRQMTPRGSSSRKKFNVTSSVTQAQDTILLQTAKVCARDSTLPRLVRCLLDGGSQRTFVMEDTAKNLSCKGVGKETLNVQTFGAMGPCKQTLRRVELWTTSRHDTEAILIEALDGTSNMQWNSVHSTSCVEEDVRALRLADDAAASTDDNIGY